MEISYYKRWSFFVPVLIHFFIILFLTVFTTGYLDSSVLPVYLIFSGIFLISTLFSLSTILRFRTGVFYYLLNIMFLLGFWFKYSVQKITQHAYREPIGPFVLTPESEVRVLWVVVCGMLGYLLAQLCSYYLFKKDLNDEKENDQAFFSKKKLAIILFFTLVLTIINLKFNILLFAFKPSVELPFKANAIYFLALTRGLMFLFLYYCFRAYSNKMVFWGGLIACISSIGVISRMVVLIYFSVLCIFVLQNLSQWHFKKTLKNILLISLNFILFSYLTVLISSGLRSMYIAHPPVAPKEAMQTLVPPSFLATKENIVKSNIEPIEKTKYFDISNNAKVYLDLALGRWVGIEGVMAVDSYPKKSFAFLWEALHEEGYRGRSFYTRISNPEFSTAPSESPVISTSVPGPVAFFYYTGSLFFVFFGIAVSSFLFSLSEKIVFKFFNKHHVLGIFVSTFIVADFFQFGISPMAFMRYLSFSLFCVAGFYYLVEYKKLKLPLFQ